MDFIGIDIGGTKCVVSFGREYTADSMEILYRADERETKRYTAMEMLEALASDIEEYLSSPENSEKFNPSSIGISCGGPLNSREGIILSPPNLIGWDEIKITDFYERRFKKPVFLCNDANAGALVEWKYGAGKGCENMIFLTFGTGMGAGFILNGRLYEGTSDCAGEVGHIRLDEFGPAGFGKRGSFEGFCSGGGIAKLGQLLYTENLQSGKKTALCKSEEDLNNITTKKLADAARAGDEIAKEVFRIAGEKLGLGLSILIDILNPQKIVIGGVFMRAEDLLREEAQRVIDRESLVYSRRVCEITACEMGEKIGDMAALSVASYYCGLSRNGLNRV